MSRNDAVSIREFFATWNDGSEMRKFCESLYAHMALLPGVGIGFVSRPNVSHSVRMTDGDGNILALLDVIDDDPAARWLSLCFPDHLVSDPDDAGDVVPQGLSGKDARCFSVDAIFPETEGYMKARLDEAAR